MRHSGGFSRRIGRAVQIKSLPCGLLTEFFLILQAKQESIFAMKKETPKDKPASPSFFQKMKAVFKSETIRFVIGLVLVIFSVYLLLAFSSFFVTGAADQSIIDGGEQQLASADNGVKNYAGSRGAQLASYLINDCFGVSSFFILVFLTMAGLKLMKVRTVRLWRWFIGCSLLMIWWCRR